MCGRYTLTKSIKTIESHFRPLRISLKYFPSFNIAPSQFSAVITNSFKQLNLTEKKWGMVPSWSKDATMGNKLINARSETLHEKPSFRESFKNQRCLIPADGFIEWKGKKPYYIRKKTRVYLPLQDYGPHGMMEMILSTPIQLLPLELIKHCRPCIRECRLSCILLNTKPG